MSFSKIVGQNRAVSLLQADLSSDRIAESYLFVGPPGVGKRTAALEFSKALNCNNNGNGVISGKVISGKDRAQSNDVHLTTLPPYHSTTLFKVDSCDLCAACRKIDSGNHPDIFLLDFESQAQLLELKEDERIRQKDFQIDAIRILINRAHLTPVEAKKKVFIIDGAEHLNRASANALLKDLEETSMHARWILIAVSLERVLPTIRSRCRSVSFARLGIQEIQSLLNRRSLAKDQPEMKEIAEMCDGSMETALALLDDEWLELAQIADKVLNFRQPFAIAAPLETSARIVAESKRTHSKKRADQFLKILCLKISRELRSNPHPDLAENLSFILRAQEELRRNASPQMVLDALLTTLSSDK